LCKIQGVQEWYAIWGLNIRIAREQQGLSREQLAEMVGVSLATVSRWEAGKLGIRDSHKLRLADALDRDVRQLFPLARGGAK
jgi:transcriptional regulator with XRE-family HTH domain